jgi:hypothetical protein
MAAGQNYDDQKCSFAGWKLVVGIKWKTVPPGRQAEGSEPHFKPSSLHSGHTTISDQPTSNAHLAVMNLWTLDDQSFSIPLG